MGGELARSREVRTVWRAWAGAGFASVTENLARPDGFEPPTLGFEDLVLGPPSGGRAFLWMDKCLKSRTRRFPLYPGLSSRIRKSAYQALTGSPVV